jgi:oligopeptide transport system substrate-binding protein
MRKRLLALFSALIVGALLLSACGGTETVVETVVVEKEGETVIETVIVEKEPEAEMLPVTLNMNLGTEPPTLDPSLATDTTSVDLQENLFVGLTRFDAVTNEVVPYLATEWEIGEDADGNQTWTFYLRDDVPWVKYDPVTGETTQEVDADGNPRFVNAFDVEYGVKRTVDPATGSDYAYVTYIIKNAAAINGGDEELTIDDLGVKALDETTLQFTLEAPAGYFSGISTMWIVKPMPQWAIEEWGDKWTEAGLISTSGPYVLETWIHGGELSIVKNPLWIEADSVQIERADFVMITEASTAFALYENNELDSTAVPLPEMDRVKADPVLSEEFYSAPVPCTYYYGFTNNKPPLDDVRVRRALSQAIDRKSLVENVTKGGQIPATSFAPPGIFAAPAPGEVGLGYDPDAAKAAFQEYLDEKGMTVEDFNAMDVVLMHNTSEGHARIAAAIQQFWADVLGVEVRVENQEWAVYLTTLQNTTPLADMPHIWRLGWCADYPDENNWVHEVFNAEAGANRLRRTAGEFDELTAAAAIEQDPDVRVELYREAETILTEVETAFAPIYHYTTVAVTKPWLTRNYPAIGGIDIFTWKLDMDAKLAAMGQ